MDILYIFSFFIFWTLLNEFIWITLKPLKKPLDSTMMNGKSYWCYQIVLYHNFSRCQVFFKKNSENLFFCVTFYTKHYQIISSGNESYLLVLVGHHFGIIKRPRPDNAKNINYSIFLIYDKRADFISCQFFLK